MCKTSVSVVDELICVQKPLLRQGLFSIMGIVVNLIVIVGKEHYEKTII